MQKNQWSLLNYKFVLTAAGGAKIYKGAKTRRCQNKILQKQEVPKSVRGSNLPAKKFVNMTNFARKFWKNFLVMPPAAQKFMPLLEWRIG